MKLQQKINIDINDLQKMQRNDIAKLLQDLRVTANKRIKRIEKNNLYSFALLDYEKNKSKSFRAMNKNQLVREYNVLTNFLKADTSSVTGIRKLEKKIADRLGGKFENIDQSKIFWETYNKIKQNEPAFLKEYGSERLQQMIFEEQDGHTSDTLFDIVMERIDDIYLSNFDDEEVENFDFTEITSFDGIDRI